MADCYYSTTLISALGSSLRCFLLDFNSRRGQVKSELADEDEQDGLDLNKGKPESAAKESD